MHLFKEDIRLYVIRARSIGHEEIKAAQKERPAGLSGVEAMGRMQIGEIFVASPDDERMLGALQPVPPLLQGPNHSQQLCFQHHNSTLLGKGNRRKRRIDAGLELKDPAERAQHQPWSLSIHFDHELEGWIGMKR